jgi:hypothetical protein
LVLDNTKSTGVKEPTPLWNQNSAGPRYPAEGQKTQKETSPTTQKERVATLLISSSLFGRGNERRGEFFVKGEEVFHAVAVGIEGLRAVAEVNGAVEVGVGFHQRGLHVPFSP